MTANASAKMDHMPASCFFPQCDDMTAYAQSLGYRGKRRVHVLDGKVISHRSINWFDFCAALRGRQRNRPSS